MAKGQPLDVRRILSVAQADTRQGTSGYSPLFIWLWRRYDELAPTLGGPGPVNWHGLAEKFAEAGITDGAGRPPTFLIVRRTWWKVSRAKAAAAKGATADPRYARRLMKSAAKPEVPDAVVQAAAMPPSPAKPVPPKSAPAEDDDDTGFRFAGATRYGRKDD